jgi:hypothetical protein
LLKLKRKDGRQLGYALAPQTVNGDEEAGFENVPLLAPTDTELTVLYRTEGGLLSQYSIHAKRIHAGAPWLIAVHLTPNLRHAGKPDEAKAGNGACSHAVLHVHIGPDFKAPQTVRAPLPRLLPAEALAWVLTQLEPGKKHEPAPW